MFAKNTWNPIDCACRSSPPLRAALADSRAAQGAVIDAKAVERTAVHRAHNVACIESCGLCLGLDVDRDAIGLDHVERIADVLVAVAYGLDAVERVTCEMRDREEKQRGEAEIGQRVRSDDGSLRGHGRHSTSDADTR